MLFSKEVQLDSSALVHPGRTWRTSTPEESIWEKEVIHTPWEERQSFWQQATWNPYKTYIVSLLHASHSGGAGEEKRTTQYHRQCRMSDVMDKFAVFRSFFQHLVLHHLSPFITHSTSLLVHAGDDRSQEHRQTAPKYVCVQIRVHINANNRVLKYESTQTHMHTNCEDFGILTINRHVILNKVDSACTYI